MKMTVDNLTPLPKRSFLRFNSLVGYQAPYDDLSLCQPPSPLKKPVTDEETVAFKVYPNPAGLYTLVELSKAAIEAGDATLTNALGQQVHVSPFGAGDKNILMIFENVPAGVYYLTVRVGNTLSSDLFTVVK